MLGRVALHRRLAVHRPGGIVWSQPWVCFWKITLLLNPRVCFKNHLVSHIAKKNGHGKRENKGEQKFVFLKKNRTAGTKDKPCIVIMLSDWDSRRLFRQGWSCALWVATLLEELVCLPSWTGRAGSQVPSGSLRLSGSAYYASVWSQPQPGLCPRTCDGGENRRWCCRQRNRGGTRIHLCHFSMVFDNTF